MPFRPSPTETLLLDEFRRRLVLAAPGQVAALRVFGSRARGEGVEHSDLDVAVEPGPHAARRRLQSAAVGAAWDAMQALRLEELMLSPVIVRMDGAGLAAMIAREGALVWQADAA